MIALTDVDGVLLHYEKGFSDWILKNYGYSYNAAHAVDYKMGARYGIPESQVLSLITEFNETDADKLEPFRDSQMVVSELAQDFDCKFVAITSFGTNTHAVRKRSELLVRLFGNVFDDIICLPLGSDKHEQLAKWKNTGLFWIEDYPDHAHSGKKLGLNSILITHNYNEYFDHSVHDIVRVQNWKEIKESISKGH